jgi:host factor-I protein
MPNPAESHPQNDFMNAARKERKRVEIYLVNGIRLTGCIESFDQYLVMLRTPVGVQGIYKRAISTIQLDTGTRPGPRGPRPGGHSERHGPRDGFSPRESRDSHGAGSAPAERAPDAPAAGSGGPVVVTRRRRPYGASHGGNESGDK